MGMEEKNILVKQYNMERGAELNNKYLGIVDDNKINRAIAMFTNSEKSLEKPKVKILTKTNNEKSSSSSSSGFVDILMLVLISGFVAGAIFMIIYIIMK